MANPTNDQVLVSVTHRFDASAERVYDAFLDPGSARKFMFATATGQVVQCDIDARVGGAFTIVDRRNGEDVAHTGTYLALDRPRRIVFSLAVPKYSTDVTTVTITIAPLGQGCEVTLTHEMKATDPTVEKRARDGWAGILEAAADSI